jgi:RimJ/RimL family protein N-acetyltransferase
MKTLFERAMRDLETDRLLIRAVRMDDLDAFGALIHVSFDAPFDADSYRDLVAFNALGDRVHAALRQPPYGDRGIVLKESQALVGAVGFVACLAPFDQLPSMGGTPDARFTPELGLFWALSPGHRGRGLATEAARAMIGYAFDELRLRRIVATTESDNAASIAVMRRLGMTIEHNPFPAPPWFQTVGILEARADHL